MRKNKFPEQKKRKYPLENHLDTDTFLTAIVRMKENFSQSNTIYHACENKAFKMNGLESQDSLFSLFWPLCWTIHHTARHTITKRDRANSCQPGK